MTYAVRWWENDGPRFAGGLQLSSGGLRLTGTAAGFPAAQLAVPFGAVSRVYLERDAAPGGQPSLVLVTCAGDRVAIVSLQGLGALHEVADQVAAGRGKSAV